MDSKEIRDSIIDDVRSSSFASKDIIEILLNYISLLEEQLFIEEKIGIVKRGDDGGYIELILNKQYNKIPLNLHFYDSTRDDCFVGKSLTPIESYDYKSEKELTILDNWLRKWLTYPIKEIIYESGSCEFRNSETDEIIYRFDNMKISNLFKRKKIKEINHYEPWIN